MDLFLTVGGERYVTGRAAYLKSKDLKWETAKTTDIGIELGFFNNDLTLSLDYFVKKERRFVGTDRLEPVFRANL